MTNEDRLMRRSLVLAEAAADRGEVPVGALVHDPVRDIIVGEGANGSIAGHDPTAHAEIIALRDAGQKLDNYRLPGLDLYVTLEPCAMCAGAISLARIRRVIFAATDPKGGALLHGPRFFEQPTCHWRPEVAQGPFADEAGDMLRRFFRARR